MSRDDFASLMESTSKTTGRGRRLTAGEVVEGTVLQVGPEFVFVDIGMPTDARIDRSEVSDAKGNATVQVGERLRARVVEVDPRAPRLAIAMGRSGSAIDARSLELARESGAAVQGQVTKVVKGGLQVEVGGVRAFCPASQVDVSYVADLQPFEGQTLDFKVTDIREGGRNVIVSRRALLEDQRRERTQELLQNIQPGSQLEGVVTAIQKHGAIVDLAGAEGFVHISELMSHRVDRVEDVVKLGETVQVRVVSIEQGDRGARIRLSMKQPGEAKAAPPTVDEVLEGSVTRAANFGVFVQTAKGEGLVPISELGLPPGADHRRAFAPGTPVRVVLLSHDAGSGKLRFSATKVASVEERKNFRDFATQGAGEKRSSGSLGSLGDLLRNKFGSAATQPASPSSQPVTPPAASAARPTVKRRS
jgi:small subunit ribosomal protein S1